MKKPDKSQKRLRKLYNLAHCRWNKFQLRSLNKMALNGEELFLLKKILEDDPNIGGKRLDKIAIVDRVIAQRVFNKMQNNDESWESVVERRISESFA